MSEELVSIIMPVYNVENYLQRAIQSARQQTYSNLEIILVDDGSTDLSGDICAKEKVVDNRIVVLHKKNGGLASARNAGIRIATGKYLFFLDSDDTIALETISVMVQKIEEQQCDLVVCSMVYKYVNSEGAVYHQKDAALEREGLYKPIDFLCYFLSDVHDERNITECSCNKLYKRSMFVDGKRVYPEHIRRSEDTYFFIDFLPDCQKIYYLKKGLYHYYRYNNDVRKTLTNSYDKNRFDVYKELYIKLYDLIHTMVSEREIIRCRHNFADKVILSCVMLCRPDATFTEEEIKEKLFNIVWDKMVIEAMTYYKRKPNNSWTVPLLINRKKVDYLFYFARKIAKRRYAK